MQTKIGGLGQARRFALGGVARAARGKIDEMIGAATAPAIRPTNPDNYADYTPEDFARLGDKYGVENLGGEKPLIRVGVDGTGREIFVPGGLDDTMSYSDMLFMKAQGYDPSQWDRKLHGDIQRKLLRSMNPQMRDSAGNVDTVELFNRNAFGLLSPNKPLTPNELELARVRARTPEDVEEWADRVPWRTGDDVDQDLRRMYDKQIGIDFGTQAGSAGGLGVRGSPDYTNLAEFAQLIKKKPDWYLRRDNEDWSDYLNRYMSQTRGATAKVGSFSGVWQAPETAGMSAIDRHMANQLKSQILSDPAERKGFETSVVSLFNKRVEQRKQLDAALRAKRIDPKSYNESVKALGFPSSGIGAGGRLKQARNLEDVMRAPGGQSAFDSRLMSYVTKDKKSLRVTKGGELNKNVTPELLRESTEGRWIEPPDYVQQIGEPYARALAANRRLAAENDLGLFGSQWMEWDRIRRRFEPHEVMFPGLYRLPKMEREELLRAIDQHKRAGYFNSSKDLGVNDYGDEVKKMKPARYVEKPGGLAAFNRGGAVR